MNKDEWIEKARENLEIVRLYISNMAMLIKKTVELGMILSFRLARANFYIV